MSLNFRRDKRTVKQFEKDIKDAHTLEEKIATAVKIHLEFLWKETVSVYDNGADGKGGLIKNLKKHTVDRVYYIGGRKYSVEIKTAPHEKYFTFKVSSLKSCAKEHALIIVWVKGAKYIYVASAKNVKLMLELDSKIYYAFSPNDKAVRIQKEDLDKYFIKYNLCAEALEELK